MEQPLFYFWEKFLSAKFKKLRLHNSFCEQCELCLVNAQWVFDFYAITINRLVPKGSPFDE